jgi:hypothetical protein
MKMSVRHFALCALVCLAVSAVNAQIAMTRGAPFEATRTVSVNRPGEQFTTSCTVARSSNGSLYQEVPDNKTGTPGLILISDVPGRRTIVLDVKKKFYTIGELSLSSVSDGPSPEDVQKRIDQSKTQQPIHSSQDGIDITITPLGLRTQEGFIENGQRRVMSSALPSSKLKEKIWESWWIPALNINVENTAFDDDNKPVQTTKLTNIRTIEPHPSLFEIPPGYALSPPPPSR